MTIPTVSLYPDNFDTSANLYLVHDALRLRLAEDYNPGDTRITIEGDAAVLALFPPTGEITLTEQCSEPDKRAISFYYGAKTDTGFSNLELLPGFEDVEKLKRITNITMNVMADHHNNIKDALIAIEEFIGVAGTTDTAPLGETIEGRLNFLTKLILTPRAWFSVNKQIGLVPLEITFKDESLRTGNCDVIYIWDFGDSPSGTSVISTISYISVISTSGISGISLISATSVVPLEFGGVLVRDLDGGTIKKTYATPGRYNVSLRVMNRYGEDTVLFQELINARLEAPDEAVIDFIPRSGQIIESGDPIGGPYTTPPRIRAQTGTIIDMEIPSGINPNTGRTYGGEEVDVLDSPLDPINTYTWLLSDDLEHANQTTTRATYSVGGFYDLTLRVDTEFGSYRITTYEDSIDIVESQNLWLWLTNNAGTSMTSYEFGFISETFKTRTTPLTLTRDDSFLDGSNNEDQAKQEFARNVGFAPRTTTGSGAGGTSHIYYSTGGPVIANQEIAYIEYNGFSDTYQDQGSVADRPWNWVFLTSDRESFFVFGQQPPPVASGSNPSYQTKTRINLTTQLVSEEPILDVVYANGAEELKEHVSFYDSGIPTNGYFAVYRATWRSETGFILRNSGVGSFYRIRSFYQTVGSLVDPFQQIAKLSDMAGPTKLEGQLVPLTNGVFFFNNSSSISAYNPESGLWETGGPALTSTTFRSLQDTAVTGFDSPSNSLLAASDNDRVAYLSFDYSSNAFIKYNGADNTFSGSGSRPAGNQFLIGVY